MDKCRLNIAIVEPSSIIYEGLSNILLQKGGTHFSLFRFENIEEVTLKIATLKIDLVILNPSHVKHNIKTFYFHKNNNTVAWVALIYSFFERETVDLFDAVIQITDAPELIINTIEKLFSLKCHCKPVSREQLTHREIDVLRCLAQGMLNKEIADQLNISTHTIVSHRKNIIRKTGIKSQSGLTIYAISNNIINIEDYRG